MMLEGEGIKTTTPRAARSRGSKGPSAAPGGTAFAAGPLVRLFRLVVIWWAVWGEYRATWYFLPLTCHRKSHTSAPLAIEQ
jgi:hypothetical protein